MGGDTCADKSGSFLGRGHPVEKGTQGNRSVTRPAVSGLMVMGFVSGVSLADHSDSESFRWCRPSSAQMDAREKDSGR